MKKSHRALSLLLSAALTAGLLAVPASAAGKLASSAAAIASRSSREAVRMVASAVGSDMGCGSFQVGGRMLRRGVPAVEREVLAVGRGAPAAG